MKTESRMRIEIMAIGSELLTPYFQDTNSLYLTQRLNDLGMRVSFKTIVGDDWEELVLAIKETLLRADLIFAVGGLGPTEDDRTREVFAQVLERKLIFKREILQKIKERFKRRGLLMPAPNKKQSFIIDGAEILENRNGTAPGMWIGTGQRKIVLLPGPPHELKPMFEKSVWPRLQELRSGHMVRKVLKITGLTESKIESLISNLYPHDFDLKMTTLASPGEIEIHLTAFSGKNQNKAEKKIQELATKIAKRLKDNIFSTSGEGLEELVGRLLREQKKTLAVAESCTGGFLSHRLTNIPGSSDYFLQGVVAYSNKAKTVDLGVPLNLIENYGAVSSEVAQAMARGIRKKAQSSYGLAITGIAGPSGGSPEKPVGLVYAALAWERGSEVQKSLFLGEREQIKFQSSQKALDMLRRNLLKSQKEVSK